MSQYADLLTLLRDCSDQKDDELQILSTSLLDHKDILDEYDIKYETQAEGIFIDLASQDFKIFKTRVSAVDRLSQDDFSSNILIIEKTDQGEDIIYENKQSSSELFENILYFRKFKEFFVNDEIASHYDELKGTITFLSAKYGRLDAGYGQVWVKNFHENNNDLKNQLEVIQSKISEDGKFKDFFRESYIDSSKNLPDLETRFAKSLTNIKHIVESATRNYELYQHNFSFADFRKELNEDKEKYIKDYQSNLSDFLSKIAYMPIQFGAYIFLTIRFGEELIPIMAVAILIVAWTFFSVYSLTQLLDNIEYLKKKFTNNFSLMLEKSGLPENEVSGDREEISGKFNKSISLIKCYRWFVVIFSLSVFVVCVHFICGLMVN